MIHLHTALDAYKATKLSRDGELVPDNHVVVSDSMVAFHIQDGPIKEVGVNGMQVTDMLEYVKEVYKSLNHAFPCRENSITITKIEEAIHWQDARTKDRESRGVEGHNKD